jgi:hypothetical protein
MGDLTTSPSGLASELSPVFSSPGVLQKLAADWAAVVCLSGMLILKRLGRQVGFFFTLILKSPSSIATSSTSLSEIRSSSFLQVLSPFSIYKFGLIEN